MVKEFRRISAPAAMFTEANFTAPFGSLHYAAGPCHGPPLVLLHGVTRGWRDWSPLLPVLAARWQVYALDFRGHGGSARTPGRYRVVDYVLDAREFLGKMCPSPPVVLGHSLGAMVALAAAADPALKLRGVILEDPPFETMGSRIRKTPFLSQFQGMKKQLAERRGTAELARGLARIKLVTPGKDSVAYLGQVRDATALRFSARCLTRLDPEVLDPIIAGEWLDEYDLHGLLGTVRCPLLLLQADTHTGGMLTDGDADLIESALTDCSRVKLDGVGHLVHWMETATMLRLVTGFLESL
jgi:pimeloyl-ACP methyl ester carboxylesterase